MPTPDSSYREIHLTNGGVTLVDLEDFEKLSLHGWYKAWNRPTRSYYAIRSVWIPEEKKVTTVRMHREILGLKRFDKRQGDHENHDTLDNRRFNLRLATNSQNTRNQHRRADNTSGYKGVHLHSQSGKWRAVIMSNGDSKSLGLFHTREQAYEAYCAAAGRIHREFAMLV